MPDWEAIGDQLWKALAELDADLPQAEAEKDFQVALIGAPGCGKTSLACALAATPAGESMSPDLEEYLPEYRLPLSVEDVTDLDSATLLILLLDATKGNYAQEVAAADYLSYLGKPMLVCYNKMDLLPVETRLIRGQARWRGAEIMPLSATQPDAVQELLLPAVLEVLPQYALSLARRLALFRSMVADSLIEHTALVNATYASASGLAEAVPLLRVPFNAEEVEVLGANQATMACRLGLAYALALDWHHDVSALSVAVKPGRVWRQLARRVLGVVPLWGLDSKVGVAYGATIVMGRVIEAWCDTGEALSPRILREMCRDTAVKSRAVSHDLVAKAREALPAQPRGARSKRPKLRLPRPHLPRRRQKPMCAACGRGNPADAVFCAYCGGSLEEAGAAADQAADHPVLPESET
jgi:uncharacterized protein (DUF697 family)